MSKIDCWRCMDTGWEGVARACECATGVKVQRKDWLYASGVPSIRQDEKLSAFEPKTGTREALVAAKQIVAGKLNWLLLYGGTGNGKTHLGYGIVMGCIENGRRARIVNSLVLLSDLRAVSGTPAQMAHMKDLATIPVLVLDDYFWATDYEARWLEEVIQRRYITKLPLVVTTNLDGAALPAPMRSRFRELGKVILNKGEDYRRGRGT